MTEWFAELIDVLLECVGDIWFLESPIATMIQNEILETLFTVPALYLLAVRSVWLVILWTVLTLLRVALCSFLSFSFSLNRESFFFSNFSSWSDKSDLKLTRWSRSKFHLARSYLDINYETIPSRTQRFVSFFYSPRLCTWSRAQRSFIWGSHARSHSTSNTQWPWHHGLPWWNQFHVGVSFRYPACQQTSSRTWVDCPTFHANQTIIDLCVASFLSKDDESYLHNLARLSSGFDWLHRFDSSIYVRHSTTTHWGWILVHLFRCFGPSEGAWGSSRISWGHPRDLVLLVPSTTPRIKTFRPREHDLARN